MNIISIICLCAAITVLAVAINDHEKTIGKQQTQIEQLTERVLLLENALSDKSGIKPEKTK